MERINLKYSIIICTYNRCSSLDDALDSIEKMDGFLEYPGEVLVVDNNSSDGTAEIVARHSERFPGHGSHVFEEKQGKSFALNTAVASAKGKILVFTDDDCIVSPNWIASVIKEFECDPEVMGLGGRVELSDKRCKSIAVRSIENRFLLSSFPFSAVHIPIIGNNMSFKRKVFDEVGGFDVNLGPGSGNKAVSEDLDFLYRVCKRGYKVIYSPDMLVYHNHGLMTDQSAMKVKQQYIVGRGAFYWKHILSGDRYALKMAYWELCFLMKGYFRKRYKGTSSEEDFFYIRNLLKGAWFQTKTLLYSRHSTGK